ncbi:MAG: helix-turn-helix transcriptional regulator [Blastocatellia bacterium]|nr:helix-turn-helix transcriptional regulator [Blastocatellia bacterium]
MPHPVNKKLLKQFGDRIRSLRTARGLTQEKLAELTGFHRTYIGMIERGERNLSIANIGVFAKLFDLSLSELFLFEDKRGGR